MATRAQASAVLREFRLQLLAGRRTRLGQLLDLGPYGRRGGLERAALPQEREDVCLPRRSVVQIVGTQLTNELKLRLLLTAAAEQCTGERIDHAASRAEPCCERPLGGTSLLSAAWRVRGRASRRRGSGCMQQQQLADPRNRIGPLFHERLGLG